MIGLRHCIAMISGLCLSIPVQSLAQDSLFNLKLLEIDHPVDVDIRQFNRSNALPLAAIKLMYSLTANFLNVRK